MQTHATRRHAFSLVELSIVLVILGLLVGGILSGQSLIRAAELRSVTTESQRYTTAMYSFRDKYFALPGDMANATAFWGKDNVNCTADTGTTATPGTCNGDGDGHIPYFGTVAVPSRESLHFWQQLALAGLVEGNYTGIGVNSAISPGTGIAVGGTNVPNSKLGGGAVWNAFWFDINHFEASNWVDLPTKNTTMLVLGGQTTNYWANNDNVLTPTEAWNIDTKADDGNGATGKVRAGNNNIGHCETTTNSTTQTYKLTSTTKECMLAFDLNIQ